MSATLANTQPTHPLFAPPAFICCLNRERCRGEDVSSSFINADSGAAATTRWNLDIERLVNAVFVESLNKLAHRKLEDLADSESRAHSNWPTRFYLLPVARGEAKRKHVLLRVTPLLTKPLNSDTQGAKKLFLICHT